MPSLASGSFIIGFEETPGEFDSTGFVSDALQQIRARKTTTRNLTLYFDPSSPFAGKMRGSEDDVLTEIWDPTLLTPDYVALDFFERSIRVIDPVTGYNGAGNLQKWVDYNSNFDTLGSTFGDEYITFSVTDRQSTTHNIFEQVFSSNQVVTDLSAPLDIAGLIGAGFLTDFPPTLNDFSTLPIAPILPADAPGEQTTTVFNNGFYDDQNHLVTFEKDSATFDQHGREIGSHQIKTTLALDGGGTPVFHVVTDRTVSGVCFDSAISFTGVCNDPILNTAGTEDFDLVRFQVEVTQDRDPVTNEFLPIQTTITTRDLDYDLGGRSDRSIEITDQVSLPGPLDSEFPLGLTTRSIKSVLGTEYNTFNLVDKTTSVSNDSSRPMSLTTLVEEERRSCARQSSRLTSFPGSVFLYLPIFWARILVWLIWVQALRQRRPRITA
jgi:hypothetical protein